MHILLLCKEAKRHDRQGSSNTQHKLEAMVEDPKAEGGAASPSPRVLQGMEGGKIAAIPEAGNVSIQKMRTPRISPARLRSFSFPADAEPPSPVRSSEESATGRVITICRISSKAVMPVFPDSCRHIRAGTMPKGAVTILRREKKGAEVKSKAAAYNLKTDEVR